MQPIADKAKEIWKIHRNIKKLLDGYNIVEKKHEIFEDFFNMCKRIGLIGMIIFIKDESLKKLIGSDKIYLGENIEEKLNRLQEELLKQNFIKPDTGNPVLLIDIFSYSKSGWAWINVPPGVPFDIFEESFKEYFSNSKKKEEIENYRKIFLSAGFVGDFLYIPSYKEDSIFFDCSFLFKQENSIILYWLRERLCVSFINDLHNLLRMYLANLYSHLIAVSSIMIRNFSHHHGSHVLPRIQITENNSNDVKQYLLYIQEKTALMNIINVYDPICEGKVSINDTVNFFTRKNGNSGVLLFLKYFAETNGKKDVLVGNDTEDGVINEDFYVSPGYGELGKHALFIILENYIRNLLKHCKPIRSDENPVVSIKYFPHNSFINVEVSTKNYFLVENDRFCNESSAKEIIKFIENVIDAEELIYPDGRTNFEHPGLKEMRISANILSGKTPGLIIKDIIVPELKNHTINGENYYSISYKFKIPKARFVLEGTKENIDKIRNGKEVKPDFIVFDMNEENINLAFDNWVLLPQRICWIGEESNFKCPKNWNEWANWIKKRSIFIQRDKWEDLKNKSEKVQYSFLLESWYNKLFNEREVEVRIHHNVLCQYNNIFSSSNTFAQRFHFWHNDQRNQCNCGEDVVKLNFSTNSTYRIIRFLGTGYKQMKYPDNQIIPLEIKSILGFKILIVDEEIFRIYNDLPNDNKKLLSQLNIKITSEENLNEIFTSYDCVVFHLGMLEVNKELYELDPNSIPAYVRIVTGRAKPLPEEILKKCLWANSWLIDRSVFIRAFGSKDIFDIKYKIFIGVLS
jgi:hypothetical protein